MSQATGIKTQVQKLGRALSGMVMPNIGAFIAWGFITALFIEKGWWPNAQLAEMVTPMLKYYIKKYKNLRYQLIKKILHVYQDLIKIGLIVYIKKLILEKRPICLFGVIIQLLAYLTQ